MPDLTPDLSRAVEEFERLDDRHGLLYPEHALLVPDITKRLVSAALHDPNDPDALARWLHAESQEWVEADGVPTRLDWSHLHLSQQEHWRRMADALRAKILGASR
jgi:hypothetical protein